ncbi:MAG: IMP dehydrogenase [Caldilineaceae bacterium]
MPYKGFLKDFVFQLMGGLRSGMGYVEAESIPDLWQREPASCTSAPPAIRKPPPQRDHHQGSANYQIQPGR